MRSIYGLIILLFSLSACNDDSTRSSVLTPSSTDIIEEVLTSNLAIPDNRFSNNYQVILFGNSHVEGIGSLIRTMILAGNPSAEISVFNAGGGFLDDKFSKKSRSNMLAGKPWTHVILQGQKYSQSGTYTYPTIPAQTWIDKAKKQGVMPILFPEHPQEGKTTEGARVHSIHKGIADIQKSCVAPIGLAWDRVIMTTPQLSLHNADGNHASLQGRLLSAYIFYEVITGEAADLLPFIVSILVEESTQQYLRQFASEAIQANQPCMFDT
jgi:hypothetical protein